MKKGVIGCKIFVKRGDLILFTGKRYRPTYMGVPHRIFPLQVWRAAQELLEGRMRAAARRLPTPVYDYQTWSEEPLMQV